MSLSDKKMLIDWDVKEVSINKQCSYLGIHRSSLYYQTVPCSEDDIAIMHAMDRLHLEDPTLGTRRMQANLAKQGFNIGRDKVRKLMKTMRLKAVYCRPRTTISDPTKYKYPYLLRGLKILSSNHVWMIEITYMPMRQGFMYLVAIIDVFSRCIMGWDVSSTMEASWVCKCFQNAVKVYGCPQIINSDQGAQFTSEEYIGLAKTYSNLQISMDGKGRAIDNVFIERFFRTIKHEKIYLCLPQDGRQLYEDCKEFIEYYNLRSLHQSLGYITPMQKYQQVA